MVLYLSRVNDNWERVEDFVKDTIGTKPNDLKGYLFIIGVQVLGKGARYFSKEQKQDLIHIALCEIFISKGYYTFSHRDEDGWPHYDLTENIPHEKLFGQENLIKEQIVNYFTQNEYI